MTVASEVLAPRWRRLDAAVARLRAAPKCAGAETPDAAVAVLHAMYDLWELWQWGKGLSSSARQDEVAGQTEAGQTAAALIYARGEATHGLVKLGEKHGLGLQPLGVTPLGGGWYWVPLAEQATKPKLQRRYAWYDKHVKYRSVLRPVKTAWQWFASQPELIITDQGRR
jgi:hypothetical protein